MGNGIGPIEIAFNGSGGGGHHPNPTPGNPCPSDMERSPLPPWALSLIPADHLAGSTPALKRAIYGYLAGIADIDVEYGRAIKALNEDYIERKKKAEVEFLRAVLLEPG